jgi:hypothetical protein
MPNPNPLAGVVPQVTHRSDVDETTIVEQIEKIEGEIAADAYIKALVSAPQVVNRITELENCLQRLANALLAESDLERRPKLRAAAEQAGMLLKNRLEVGDLSQKMKQRIRGRLRRFLEEPEFRDDPPDQP